MKNGQKPTLERQQLYWNWHTFQVLIFKQLKYCNNAFKLPKPKMIKIWFSNWKKCLCVQNKNINLILICRKTTQKELDLMLYLIGWNKEERSSINLNLDITQRITEVFMQHVILKKEKQFCTFQNINYWLLTWLWNLQ